MKAAPKEAGSARAQGENGKPEKDNALPELTEGQTVPVSAATVKEGQTAPPKHYTEDTILNSMETAGAKDMPDDAERKGIGTPATCAAILEKPVSSCFVERRKSRKYQRCSRLPWGRR